MPDGGERDNLKYPSTELSQVIAHNTCVKNRIIIICHNIYESPHFLMEQIVFLLVCSLLPGTLLSDQSLNKEKGKSMIKDNRFHFRLSNWASPDQRLFWYYP